AVRRRSPQARGAVERAPARRSSRWSLPGADRPRRNGARGEARHRADIRHHGARRRGGGAACGCRRGNHRRAHHGAAGRGHAVHLGLQDWPLRGGARSDALQRLWCGARGHGAGTVLLESRSAGAARYRLGHPLSARVRMGVFSGTGAHCCGVEAGHGGGVSRYVFKLPDLGEGTVEAEIVNWRVKPGDTVAEDDVLVEVMTEKAAVEVPAPVSGRVLSTTGAPGDMVPVGAELIVLETQPDAAAQAPPAPAGKSAPVAAAGSA